MVEAESSLRHEVYLNKQVANHHGDLFASDSLEAGQKAYIVLNSKHMDTLKGLPFELPSQ